MKASQALGLGIFVVGLSVTGTVHSGRTGLPWCGDGSVNWNGEECDDGNGVNGDGCSITCKNEVVVVCGDGIVQSGEQCDDGNATNGDGCENNCVITSPTKCPGSQCVHRLVHSTACHNSSDDAGANLTHFGQINNNGETRAFYCWVNSDSNLSHANARFLYVDGKQGTAIVADRSRACTKKFNSSSTSCGNWKEWGPGDLGSGSVSLTAWNSDPNGMPYVYSTLGAGGTLRGLYFDN